MSSEFHNENGEVVAVRHFGGVTVGCVLTVLVSHEEFCRTFAFQKCHEHDFFFGKTFGQFVFDPEEMHKVVRFEPRAEGLWKV